MLTLSNYLPKDTEYFYSYPLGDTIFFYNDGDPVADELISARLLACAGKHIKVVVYNSILRHKSLELLRKNSDISFIPKKQIIVLPPTINERTPEFKKNELITEALIKQTSSRNLIMAQPIIDNRLVNDYQIDPKLSIWLNDKKNLDQYVPPEFSPKRYAQFRNGQDFFDSTVKIPVPCVVKVSASSSGEGIRICLNGTDFKKAKKDFKKRAGTLFVEEYISYLHNFGFQFGIPFNKEKKPHIIGYNHQVTAADGEFLGGFILKGPKVKKAQKIKKMIVREILPKIRAMGWYGVGGLDVLLTAQGKFYVIDSNFRTTGMTAYIFLTKNKLITKSMVSFTATFRGSQEEFIKNVLSLNQGKDKVLVIVSLSKKGNEYRFNGALLFEEREEVPKLAVDLIRRGIKSEILQILRFWEY
ncbi:MAG: hypothetical protein AAB933_03920 [Patescibacteria group bacterium]